MAGEKATKVVRLKPYNKNKGFLVRRLNIFGYKFLGGETPKWYKVPGDVAVDLAKLHQDQTDEDSPPAFDIVGSETEAQALEQKEEARRSEAEARGSKPRVITPGAGRGDLSTRDLPERSMRRAEERGSGRR